MQLNSQQEKAVRHLTGPCLVLAGPGSGKTAVLTERINTLIQSGIPAEEILVITFTKAAAIEMKERFDRLSDGTHPVTFGTFHSLFWGILQKELGLKSSDIIIGNARSKVLKEAMFNANINGEDNILMAGFMTELSAVNNGCYSLEEYVPKFVEKVDFVKFFNAYEALKKKYNVLDFDDMLTKAYKLFAEKPYVLKKWQNRFSFFLVDEMQDMNDIQFELIKLISKRTRNLFCVGDDDQSIYGFRGANPKLMQSFMMEFPDANKIILDHNYRNPKTIVSCSMKLIENNTIRFDKDIKSTKEEGEIKVVEYSSEITEANEIVLDIINRRNAGEAIDEMVILYRNHSDARYLVDKLLEASVPFYLKEKMPNIYTHFVINDLENYFQLAIGNVTRQRILSIMNRPNRYLHRKSVEAIGSIEGMLRFYKDNPSCYRTVEALNNDLTLIGKMSPVAAVNYIKNAMGYGVFLEEEAMKNNSSYEEYIEVLNFFKETIKDCKTIAKAIDKLNSLRLKIDYENKNKAVDRKGKIGLYTLHSSKGLEFDTVYIISANDGIIPSNKADSREEIEAERRLFYVGITRAKKNLIISYTNKKNRDRSRFLDELNYSSSNSSP